MTTFSYLGDFDRTFTGYTNKWLEDRNDVKTPYLQQDHRMIGEDYKPCDSYTYRVNYDIEQTPVMKVFFSQKNIDYLQDKMREIVFKETGMTIGRQSDEELLIIMRSYNYSDAKNLPYEIPRQVAELNTLVLKYAVYNQILPKVKGYSTFLYDNVRTNVVLPNARYVSMKGSRINRGFSDLI